MSNIAPAQIFHIVAGVYGLTIENLSQRSCGNFSTPPKHIEARGLAVLLVLRHTMATRADMCRILGLGVSGEARSVILRQAMAFAAASEVDPIKADMMERAESIIDQHHESAEPATPPLPRRAPRRVQARKIRPPHPCGVGEQSRDWWAANDAVFRRALLAASE